MRRVFFGVVAGLLLVAGLSSPAFAALPSGSTAAWQPAVAAAGSVSSASPGPAETVSCAGTTYCAAVGSFTVGSAVSGWVRDRTGGSWSTARQIPGLAALNRGGLAEATAVSCASPGNCAAGGSYVASGGSIQAFVVSSVRGVWGSARAVPGLAALNAGGTGSMAAISCSAPGDCLAAGSYLSAQERLVPFVVTESGGHWGAARALPGVVSLGGAHVQSVSCASPGNCAVVGDAASGGATPAFVVSSVSGHWSAVKRVGGTSLGPAGLVSVSCWSAGNCVAVGSYTPTRGHALAGMRVISSGGRWGSAHTIGTGASFPSSVSCVAGGTCVVAAGRYLVADAAGHWRAPVVIPPGYTVDSVSCTSASYCSAAAYFSAGGKAGVAVIDEAAGAWRQWNLLVSHAAAIGDSVTPVSCGAPGNCALYGVLSNGEAWVAAKHSVPVTVTSVAVSPARVVYGQASRVTVAVAASAGTPSGTVTVTAGTSALCVIGLSGGRGGCTLAAARLAAGTYKLAGYYGINRGFAYSHSGVVPLVVGKASTVTRLALAHASVAYGHEGTDRLSVSVAPRYAGTPSGTVLVRTGKTLLCTVKLRSRKGSCVLSAERLKPGKYKLTGTYAGTASFSPSTSAAAVLTVTG